MRTAIPLSRRHRGLGPLVVLLLLRALIPAGFMPAIGAGSLALVFCDPGVMAGVAHAGHHHHDDGAGGAAPSGECPFAQSAAPALPALPATESGAPVLAAAPAPWHAPDSPLDVPPRHAAARGPPALS
jgi:hypothetical protein